MKKNKCINKLSTTTCQIRVLAHWCYWKTTVLTGSFKFLKIRNTICFTSIFQFNLCKLLKKVRVSNLVFNFIMHLCHSYYCFLLCQKSCIIQKFFQNFLPTYLFSLDFMLLHWICTSKTFGCTSTSLGEPSDLFLSIKYLNWSIKFAKFKEFSNCLRSFWTEIFRSVDYPVSILREFLIISFSLYYWQKNQRAVIKNG